LPYYFVKLKLFLKAITATIDENIGKLCISFEELQVVIFL